MNGDLFLKYASEFCDYIKSELVLIEGKNVQTDKKSENELGRIVSECEKLNPFFTKSSQLYAIDAIVGNNQSLLCEQSLKKLIDHIEEEYSLPLEKVWKLNQGKRLLIIAAGNIPAVSFSDIFSSLSCGFSLLVKLSHNDAPLVDYLIQQLVKVFNLPSKMIETFLPDSHEQIFEEFSKKQAAILFSGSSSTKSKIAEYALQKNIPLLARDSKFSLGIIDKDFSSLSNLAFDMFQYFGAGCRSISYLMIPKGFNYQELIDAVDGRMGAMLKDSKMWMDNFLQQKAITLLSPYNQEDYLISDCFILKKTKKVFPPIGVIYFSEYEDSQEIENFISDHREQIQKIYTNFGYSQNIEITDWNDGISTVNFLKTNC